jgi:rhodanese-related sulfurtransferase
MSPRAAWRLEGLGFSEVHHYASGKAGWFAARLPMEGALAGSASERSGSSTAAWT